MATTQNTQRVSARISPKVYETLSQAADIAGATLNQFIVQSAYEKAQEVIEKDKFIRISSVSATTFFKALDYPPKPNSRLKKAVKKYRKSRNVVNN